ncbi:hypothetical protein Bca101_064918 [Brassica carinata]
MKSTRSSVMAFMGLDSDDIFFHKPRRVVGVTPDGDWAVKGSTDLLKHHFLPLIGKTTNLAETLRRREEPPSIEREAEKVLSTHSCFDSCL